ncbi:hypothetical protein GGQ80_003515 [Sphingomonas jinjuensis]|uniref:Uncharacterized protein n=1 Tax=Sphingomonas jinjuensis TaxID=535907 RepID=A0A840FC50_9SPHN|nr:hypothetical protein [Sphingomonas jinjuensis]MBB4155590.1 hypothetical protein [Sphingomonas jinjuensis]
MFVRNLAFIILVMLPCPLAAQDKPPPPATPYPPPPPPVAETEVVKSALSRLLDCFAPGTTNARDAAVRASEALQSVAGTQEWLEAREIVGAYVEQRRVQRRCISDVTTLREQIPFTEQDDRAIRYSLQIYGYEWLRGAEVEAAILRRLAGLAADTENEVEMLFFPPTAPCDCR